MLMFWNYKICFERVTIVFREIDFPVIKILLHDGVFIKYIIKTFYTNNDISFGSLDAYLVPMATIYFTMLHKTLQTNPAVHISVYIIINLSDSY